MILTCAVFGGLIGFVAVTLLGIRALSVIGMIAAPVYVVLDIMAIGLAASNTGLESVTSYQGGAGAAAAPRPVPDGTPCSHGAREDITAHGGWRAYRQARTQPVN